jgi:hypothetical protein
MLKSTTLLQCRYDELFNIFLSQISQIRWFCVYEGPYPSLLFYFYSLLIAKYFGLSFQHTDTNTHTPLMCLQSCQRFFCWTLVSYFGFINKGPFRVSHFSHSYAFSCVELEEVGMLQLKHCFGKQRKGFPSY